jgi:hypothetical protein
MRTLFLFSFFLVVSPAIAQKGDELLVYSLKGNVTVIEDNKESKARIGKVLKPGSLIKTRRDAKLTMVCKEGRPISVTKEGSFPVLLWRDSCNTRHASVTTKYFQYIWDQLYTRSDDYKNDHAVIGGVGETPMRGNDEKEILFNEWMDSMNYAGGAFPLSWTTNFGYAGNYHFVLVNSKTRKTVFQDSLSTNSIQLEKLKKYMRSGNSYSWSIATKPTGTFDGGIVAIIPFKNVSQQVLQARKDIAVPETAAAQYFRIAFALKENGYLADAYSYLRKAAEADPSTAFYTEILEEFETRFFIDQKTNPALSPLQR